MVVCVCVCVCVSVSVCVCLYLRKSLSDAGKMELREEEDDVSGLSRAGLSPHDQPGNTRRQCMFVCVCVCVCVCV